MNSEALNGQSRLAGRPRIRFFLLLLVILLIIVGFDTRALKRAQGQLRPLALPSGHYLSAGWQGENELLVTYRPAENIDWEHALWHLSLEENRMQPVRWEDDLLCKARRMEMPQRLLDGQITYLLRCMNNSFRETNHIMGYNPDQDIAASLTGGQWLSLMEIDPLSGSYSWASDMNSLLISEGDYTSISNLYYGIRVNDHVEIDILFTSDFNYAFGATYSPVGEQVALLAADASTLVALARAMTNRPVQKYHLYLMNHDLKSGERLVRNLYYPSVPAWSPDGRWIVIGGRVGNVVKTEGLWLINVETRRFSLLARGFFRQPAWSVDSERIVALSASDHYARPDGLVIIEVAHLLE
jgi:hypothetical protein